jgi:glucokinase
MQTQLGLGKLHAINDFAAQAWALSRLGDADVAKIGRGQIRPGFPKVVLGPGTGLGVASAVPAGATWQIIPGEGGHASLAAHDEVEDGVLRRARERFGHCSAERVLSGPGLSFLDAALHGHAERAPDEIGTALAAGETEARATLEVFFRILGGVAGDLALTFGAFGGVYISGGIAPRYLDLMRESGFRERFEAKGRYHEYLGAIPTFVVTAQYAALEGLVAFLLAAEKAT